MNFSGWNEPPTGNLEEICGQTWPAKAVSGRLRNCNNIWQKENPGSAAYSAFFI